MLLITSLWTIACSGKDDGSEAVDARLIVETFTWTCLVNRDEDQPFPGVPLQRVSLELAPGAITDLAIPAAGDCERNAVTAPQITGEGRENGDLPASMAWGNSLVSGELSQEGAGFWKGEKEILSCHPPETMAVVSLSGADSLAGITSPAPSSWWIHYEGGPEDGLDHGEEIPLSWTGSGWDDAWVTIERIKREEVWESVTCGLGTDTNETVTDSRMWDLMDDSLVADANELYLTLAYSEVHELDDGTQLEVQTRMTVNPTTYE